MRYKLKPKVVAGSCTVYTRTLANIIEILEFSSNFSNSLSVNKGNHDRDSV